MSFEQGAVWVFQLAFAVETIFFPRAFVGQQVGLLMPIKLPKHVFDNFIHLSTRTFDFKSKGVGVAYSSSLKKSPQNPMAYNPVSYIPLSYVLSQPYYRVCKI